jgi:hypothetical protein
VASRPQGHELGLAGRLVFVAWTLCVACGAVYFTFLHYPLKAERLQQQGITTTATVTRLNGLSQRLGAVRDASVVFRLPDGREVKAHLDVLPDIRPGDAVPVVVDPADPTYAISPGEAAQGIDRALGVPLYLMSLAAACFVGFTAYHQLVRTWPGRTPRG